MTARLTRNGVVAMLWPVAIDGFTMKPVAHFFDYSDAADFAREHGGYIGEPIYDHLMREEWALQDRVMEELKFTVEMQAKRRAA